MKKKNFQLVANEYFNVQGKLRKACLRYLKSTLKKNGGRIDFDEDEDGSISVPYDGGNHPEYASNLYSVVNSVYFNKRGEIVLDIEDDNEVASPTPISPNEVTKLQIEVLHFFDLIEVKE